MKYAAFDRYSRSFLRLRPRPGTTTVGEGGVLVGDSEALVVSALKKIFGDGDGWVGNRFAALPAPLELDDSLQVDAARVIEERVLH